MPVAGKKYKIKSRNRFTLFVALMIVFMVMTSNTLLGFNNASSLTERAYIEITVEAGDTLWDIANEYMTGYGDVRRAVYTLCVLNGIAAHELRAGLTLRIPLD